MKKINILFLLMLTLFACRQDKKTKLQTFEWILGTWANYSEAHAVFESWTTGPDNQLLGKSYAIDGKDTIQLETIKLKEENGTFYYLPTVSNQNNGKEITFTLLLATDTSFIFQNPEHDFPQQIAYYRIGADSMLAILEGIHSDAKKQYRFPMKRKQS